MKLSEYIDMRCIIYEYARLQEWRAEELYKADYWPKHIYATIGICLKKADWARDIVKKMDLVIADWWGFSDGWTNDGSISDEAWKKVTSGASRARHMAAAMQEWDYQI